MTDLRHEMRASPLELFFDLVFVFGMTQVAVVLRGGDDPEVFLHGVMLLVMLMWTWTVYTWAINLTGHHALAVRLSLLGAMGASLVMATGVADAFGDDGLWFAVPLFLVRIFAHLGQWFGTPSEFNDALKTYLPLAFIAPCVLLIGGFVDDPLRTWVWLLAIAIDTGSAWTAGRGEWDVAAQHFAERYGLLVIIALGESIVAIGLGVVGAEQTAETMTALAVGFVGSAALWWSYFDYSAEAGEEHMKQVSIMERGRFARDAYSLLHVPIIIGIIFYAVAVEEAVAHPGDALHTYPRFLLSVGLALVLLGIVAASYRAVRRIPVERLAAAVALLALALFVDGLNALWYTATAVALVVVALIRERNRVERAEYTSPAG